MTYWLGRALSVWLAPLLLSAPSGTSQLLDVIAMQYRALQLTHSGALILSLGVLIAMIATQNAV